MLNVVCTLFRVYSLAAIFLNHAPGPLLDVSGGYEDFVTSHRSNCNPNSKLIFQSIDFFIFMLLLFYFGMRENAPTEYQVSK